MRPGKLPPDLLARLVLSRLGVRRPEVTLHAALGEDAAVVEVGDWAVVLAADPITGAAEGAGWLGVHVACNDVAATGVAPLGVLVTLLFPETVEPDAVAATMADVDRAARELGIEVLGGHTEVAPGLAAPIVAATAVGVAPRGQVVRTGGARPGDALVLTKWVGLEGTAILASDFADRLLPQVGAETLAAARDLRRYLSVVPEGVAAARLGATALHDPTEGGLEGALWELGEAAGVGYEVDLAAAPVLPVTRAVCAALGLDPYRLISSGALLVACPDGPAMVAGLERAGVPAALIGRVTASGRWLVAPDGRRPAEPVLQDELFRLLGAER